MVPYLGQAKATGIGQVAAHEACKATVCVVDWGRLMERADASPSDLIPDPPAPGASEVDETLLAWTLSLSAFERLDASYRAGLALDQLRALSDPR